jgi:hypothetical protein
LRILFVPILRFVDQEIDPLKKAAKRPLVSGDELIVGRVADRLGRGFDLETKSVSRMVCPVDMEGEGAEAERGIYRKRGKLERSFELFPPDREKLFGK